MGSEMCIRDRYTHGSRPDVASNFHTGMIANRLTITEKIRFIKGFLALYHKHPQRVKAVWCLQIRLEKRRPHSQHSVSACCASSVVLY